MAKRFPLEIFISATDKATAVLNRVADRIEKFHRPFANLRKAFSNFADKTGIAGVGVALKNVGADALALGQRLAVGLSVATVAVGAFIKRQADAADIINDTSDRLTIGAGALQEYTYAFKLFGVDAENTYSALDTLNKNLGLAKIGMGKALPLFRGLGIDPKQFRSVADLLPVLANRLSRISDPAKRAAIANRLLGGSGEQMATVLGKGSAELARLRKEAREMGAVIGGDALDGAGKFNDMLDRLGFTLRGVAGNALGRLYPALTRIAEGIQSAIVRYQPQIEAFAEQFAERLPVYIDNTIDALRGLRDALDPIMRVIGFMVEKFGAANTVLIAFSVIVGGKLIAALFSLGTAIASLVASFSATFLVPALIIAAVAAAVAAGWWLYKNWDKVSMAIGDTIDWIVKTFTEAWENPKRAAVEAFQWIVDKLQMIWKKSPVGMLFRGLGWVMDKVGGASGAAPVASGPPVGAGLVARGGMAAAQQVSVKVDLSNLPPGTRTSASASDGLSLDLSRGYAMPGITG